GTTHYTSHLTLRAALRSAQRRASSHTSSAFAAAARFIRLSSGTARVVIATGGSRSSLSSASSAPRSSFSAGLAGVLAWASAFRRSTEASSFASASGTSSGFSPPGMRPVAPINFSSSTAASLNIVIDSVAEDRKMTSIVYSANEARQKETTPSGGRFRSYVGWQDATARSVSNTQPTHLYRRFVCGYGGNPE